MVALLAARRLCVGSHRRRPHVDPHRLFAATSSSTRSSTSTPRSRRRSAPRPRHEPGRRFDNLARHRHGESFPFTFDPTRRSRRPGRTSRRPTSRRAAQLERQRAAPVGNDMAVSASYIGSYSTPVGRRRQSRRLHPGRARCRRRRARRSSPVARNRTLDSAALLHDADDPDPSTSVSADDTPPSARRSTTDCC